MSAETVLFAILGGAAGVHALVADRIYPDIAPQDVSRPYVVYSRVGTDYTRGISGAVLAATVSMAVTCQADARATAEGVIDAVIAAIVGSDYEVDGRAGSYDPDALAYVASVSLLYFE